MCALCLWKMGIIHANVLFMFLFLLHAHFLYSPDMYAAILFFCFAFCTQFLHDGQFSNWAFMPSNSFVHLFALAL